MKKNNVKIYTETEVKEIKTKDNAVNKVIYLNKRSGIVEEILTEKVILATGGKSYPLTGSTGDGYNIAKELGHTITKISGSLVPLISKNEDLQLCQAMQGLSLRNISMKIVDEEKNKKIYEDFGELLFTHFGVSGPTILSSSAHILRYKNVEELLKKGKIKLQIDLKPALNEEKLNLRLLRDFDKFKNKQIINSLNELLPKKMIEPVIKKAKIKNEKRINEITKQERENLIRVIKCFEITISGFRPIEEAIIPPRVIIASSIGLNPLIVISKHFITRIKFSLSCLVISLILFSFLIFAFLITGSIIFLGNNSFKLFIICLFLNLSKSLSKRRFNFSSFRAGFKSICNFIFPFFNNSSTFLYLNICAELLNIVGPDTPKCVNSNSPKSSYIFLFFSSSTIFIEIFLKDNPCIAWHNCKSSFLEIKGTNEPLILVIVCPSSLAMLYPSPVEPVSG